MREAWRGVIAHYTSFVNRYARNGTLDQQIQGNTALGRGYWNIEDYDHATLYFRASVAQWGEPPRPAQGQPPPATPAPTPGERRIREQLGEAAADAIEQTRAAAAEARFYLAERVYQRFAARRLPAYRGAGTQAAFDRWNTTTLRPFVEHQQTSLQNDATPQFTSVITMHVPNWEIAAAARLADMYYQFAQYIRNAPVPPDIQGNDDLLDAYNQIRDEFTERFITIATGGFQQCLRTATRVQWYNEWSQLCERSLNQINARQFPLADELRLEPTLGFTRAANSPPVYELTTSDVEDEAGLGSADTNDSQASSAPPAGGAGVGRPGAAAGGRR